MKELKMFGKRDVCVYDVGCTMLCAILDISSFKRGL
jgi:hypothetical protein